MRKGNKIIAGLLAAMLMTASVSVTAPKVQAANTGSTVEVKTLIEYVDMTQSYVDYFGKQDNIPTKEGYVFGGWFTDNTGSTAIKTTDEAGASAKVYAKFVPAHVLSVKAQIFSTTARTADESAKTNVRLVTSLDCKKYQNAGFDIIDMSGETDRTIATKPQETVYSALRVKESGGDKDYTPQQIFGEFNETEQRFVVLTLKNIPEAKWNSDIYVRPYWTTLEGVKVYGLGKYVYVNDGLDGWVSIPVNLHTGASVAGGLVSVEVPTSKDYTLVYKECRAGRVFSEMTAAINGNVIRCVGNSAKGADVTANDLYAVLRFKVEGNYKVGNGSFLNFTVKDLGFANNAETLVEMNIMNVRY